MERVIAVQTKPGYHEAWRPTAITFMGSLTVAAVTATALSLFHVIDATVLILIWNVGTAILSVGLTRVFGRTMSGWAAPRTCTAKD